MILDRMKWITLLENKEKGVTHYWNLKVFEMKLKNVHRILKFDQICYNLNLN